VIVSAGSGHGNVHRSLAHQWLRGLIFDLFGEDAAPPAQPRPAA